MASLFKLISLLFLGAVISSSVPCHAKTCSGYTFSGGRSFSSCTDLQHLGAALYYNHDASENAVSVAFKAPQSSTGWVAWGLNPNSTKMVGTQAVVAFHHSNGSLIAYPTRLDSYAPSMLPQPPLSFPVTDVSAEYVKKEMIIFATLRLAGGATEFNQVWQEGSTVSHDVPQAHSMAGDNIKSLGSIDFHCRGAIDHVVAIIFGIDPPFVTASGVDPTTTVTSSGVDLIIVVTFGADLVIAIASSIDPAVASSVDPVVVATSSADPTTASSADPTTASSADPAAAAAVALGVDPAIVVTSGVDLAITIASSAYLAVAFDADPTTVFDADPIVVVTSGVDPTATAASGVDLVAEATSGIDPVVVITLSTDLDDATLFVTSPPSSPMLLSHRPSYAASVDDLTA
ncbi:hypothetical protein ZIOFF_015873 [Zingiber officinale]|uniref:DOMON domain-containing protein n=1 Tax=Zingiber officinale TaxID=94328 RepID=A0A8J5LQK5_ZINOF|nr:hypothetical protein ZIOFF_015873 [Zingiber officinale]